MYFSGYVHNIRFEDPSKGFYILEMDLDQKAEVAAELAKGQQFGQTLSQRPTVKGHVNGLTIQVGAWFGFEGKWVTHKNYGRQVQISKAPVFVDGWTPETVSKLLVAHGVGSILVQQVMLNVGEDKFLETLADLELLKKVPALDDFTAKYLHQRWQTVQAYFRSLMFLGDLGLPSSTIHDVWVRFGDDAEAILSSNPWALVAVGGISFKMADDIALAMGLSPLSSGRVMGAVLSVSRDLLGAGHMFGGTGYFYNRVRMLIGDHVTKKGLSEALVACYRDGDLAIDKKTRPGTTAIYTPWALEMERESAVLLAERKITAKFGPDGVDPIPYSSCLASVGPTAQEALDGGAELLEVVDKALNEWGAGAKLTLSEKQRQGVLNALIEPVSLLIGLPGSGKTTSLRAAVRIFQEAKIPFVLCAPTGIAAKNLSARTGAEASTIHRAFVAQGSSDDSRKATYAGIVGQSSGLSGEMGQGEPWGFDQEHPYPTDVLIVDESSMIDQHLFYRLLTCTSPQCRLVIVGDAAQLPSVGPGNVLRDLVNSGRFPVVNLTEIFRQKDTSDIVYAAHDIHNGEIPETSRVSDFSLVKADNEEEAQEIICKLAKRLYDQRRNFQILSPRHAGTAGVTNLNALLRELLNTQEPGKVEVRLGQDTFREGDRIMVTKNNYKYGVYNGDVGKIERIHRKIKEMELKIFGDPNKIIRVSFREVPRIARLAYACTVHKCVSGDTLLYTKEGLREIRELARTIPFGGNLAKISCQVIGRRGWVTADQVFTNGVEHTIKVTTRCGYTLEGSHRHPVLVKQENGEEIWKKLPDLQLGDVLVMRRGAGECGQLIETVDFKPTEIHSPTARLGRIPEVLTEDLGWVLGVLVGDGNQTDVVDGRVEVTQEDSEFLFRLAHIVESQLGITPTVRPRKRVTGYRLYFHGRKVREFLAWLGLGFDKAPEKVVPWSVLRSPADVQRAFLRGLYDTDGGVSRLIHFTTASPRLAFTVQQMLLHHGIISNRYCMRSAIPERSWSAAYRIEISGCEDRRCFQTLIGFSVPSKKKLLGDLPFTRSKSNVGEIPHGQDLARRFRAELQERGGRNYPEAKDLSCLLSRVISGTSRLRISHLQVFVDSVHDIATTGIAGSEILDLYQEGIFLDPVVLIKHGQTEVFDIHVPREHCFIGNGFVNHNSQGLEYDVIVMPVLKSFRHQLQRNLLYTAITRARKKVILVGSLQALATAVANDKEDLRNTLFRERLEKVIPVSKDVSG